MRTAGVKGQGGTAGKNGQKEMMTQQWRGNDMTQRRRGRLPFQTTGLELLKFIFTSLRGKYITVPKVRKR